MAKTDGINSRELIMEILLSITRDEEYSHIVLRQMLDKYQYLSKQERSFITRVVNGTLEHMIYIDYAINQFSNVKVNKMKPVIRTILRSSVYELKFMDAVPFGATCNEAVKLAGKKGFRNLKGFVNGVLRNISRNIEHIKLPDRKKEPIRYLSIAYSMPEWILIKWQETYSLEQIEEMMKGFFTEKPTSIRVNTARVKKEELIQKLLQEGITVTERKEVPYGLYISGYDYLRSIKAFQEGLFYVQDVSSMLVSEWIGVKKDDYVIDVCAAPGGKSLHVAELLSGSGMVEARDLTESKIGLIQENIERCGLTNIRAVQVDARQLKEADIEKADVVIADLPCSGLGVIGKKSDIKYKMTLEKQKELVMLQREILHTVQSYVKPTGILMYSTCTINPEENEENTAWFLKEHPDFSLLEQEQILPGQDGQDGFFMAKLMKVEDYGKDGH